MNKLEEFFYVKPKKLTIHKWKHYLKIYDRHFSKFIGKNPVILEIGIYKGGSLEMWNDYFDGNCTIYAIDIDPECTEVPNKLERDNIKVFIGDQENRDFWKQFKEHAPKFDIIIDDGGHTMKQQIVTFEEMYSHVKDDGVYLCEDLHTSYWSSHNGGLRRPNTFIEYSKNFIDNLHAFYMPANEMNRTFRQTTNSIHYYDSIIVLEKEISNGPEVDLVDPPNIHNCKTW